VQIFLDRGHGPNNTAEGRYDPGAVSRYAKEHVMVAAVAHGVAWAQASPESVVLVPELGPFRLIQWVNQRARPGDVLLSLHMNAPANATASGVEVVYPANVSHPEDRRAEAESISAILADRLQLRDRGALMDTATPAGSRLGPSGKSRGLWILRKTKPKAYLLELGFVSNLVDVRAVLRGGIPAVSDVVRYLKNGG
jgi:N-acetylmuramoyl-L-alanine amidase